MEGRAGLGGPLTPPWRTSAESDDRICGLACELAQVGAEVTVDEVVATSDAVDEVEGVGDFRVVVGVTGGAVVVDTDGEPELAGV